MNQKIQFINSIIGYDVTNYILGQGNIGEVKIALNFEKKLVCAVKIISKDKHSPNQNNNTISAIIRGLEQQKKIDLKNVVKIYDYYESDKQLFIFQEYCNGKDLANYQFKKDGHVSEDDIKQILYQIKPCLTELNKQDIVHRDIKPENIMIHNNQIKLADFDFARVLDLEDKQNATKGRGSPRYWPIEVFSGQKYTQKFDVFSLGISLFQLIFGFNAYPFDEQTLVEDKIKAQQAFKNLNNQYILYNKIMPFINQAQKWHQKTLDDYIKWPDHIKISPELKDLLSNMLYPTENQRFSWEQMFNHPYYKNLEKQFQQKYLKIQQFDNQIKKFSYQLKLYLEYNLFVGGFNQERAKINDQMRDNFVKEQNQDNQLFNEEYNNEEKFYQEMLFNSQNKNEFQLLKQQNISEGEIKSLQETEKAIHSYNMYCRNQGTFMMKVVVHLLDEYFKDDMNKLDISLTNCYILCYLLLSICLYHFRRLINPEKMYIQGLKIYPPNIQDKSKITVKYQDKDNEEKQIVEVFELSHSKIIQNFIQSQTYLNDLSLVQNDIKTAEIFCEEMKKQLTNLQKSQIPPNLTDSDIMIQQIILRNTSLMPTFNKDTLILLRLLQFSLNPEMTQDLNTAFKFNKSKMYENFDQEVSFGKFYKNLEEIKTLNLLDLVQSWPQYPIMKSKTK